MKLINLIKFLSLCFVASLLVVFAFKTSFIKENNDLEIVFLDIGQGDCAYIKTPDNYRMLIDSGDEGSYNEKIKRFLGKRNINKLNACVVSHFHEDHFYGLYEMIGNKYIDCIYMPEVDDKKPAAEIFKVKADEYGVDYITLNSGDIVYNGKDGVIISVIFPDKTIYKNNNKEDNNDSLVLMVEYKGKKILFTGDLESEALTNLAKNKDVKADILKISHHGSKDSLSKLFIDKVLPEYSVISCGVDNVFSFPHDVVIDSLTEHNSKIYRTDLNGNITFIIDDSGEIKVKTAR